MEVFGVFAVSWVVGNLAVDWYTGERRLDLLFSGLCGGLSYHIAGAVL